ncbi:hypothetical protein Q5P01_024341 [Channa striata]|uniref:Uncharacterized protein n=1 Tax=Channa striata TaxID=64152 RepID=A0AA88J419_CHASR|nr:hypothetical protein Q5P01_024341 [Channa striata]
MCLKFSLILSRSVNGEKVLMRAAVCRMEHRPDGDLEELCPVCGDQVSGYHYGLLTCESCKGFFKRTVQNNKKYICAESQECRIDKSQRKRCPSCRFQKCLLVGMRLEAVRADRMRGGRNKFGPMYKRDRALKQQRKALIQASELRQCSPNLVSSAYQRDFTFASCLQTQPSVPTAQNDSVSHQPLSLCSLLPDSPGYTQCQCTFISNWTVKSEHSDCASSPSPVAAVYFESDELCSSSPQGLGIPQLLVEFLHCDPDELQLQNKMAARLLQEQVGWNQHDSPSTFRLMCIMADQMLFFMVEWARTSTFFKQLKLSDQMKLLHNCWSELLLLDVISRQVLYGKEGTLLLVTGQEVELSDTACPASPTLASLVQRGQELVEKLHILKVDRQEFACIKFLILFNPDVTELEDCQFVKSVQERVKGAMLEYTWSAPSQHLGRFAHLLLCLSELHSLSVLAEEYLYCKHLSAEVPCNNLLTEMLHAKQSWE